MNIREPGIWKLTIKDNRDIASMKEWAERLAPDETVTITKDYGMVERRPDCGSIAEWVERWGSKPSEGDALAYVHREMERMPPPTTDFLVTEIIKLAARLRVMEAWLEERTGYESDNS
jgi:hypothetical protein